MFAKDALSDSSEQLFNTFHHEVRACKQRSKKGGDNIAKTIEVGRKSKPYRLEVTSLYRPILVGLSEDELKTLVVDNLLRFTTNAQIQNCYYCLCCLNVKLNMSMSRTDPTKCTKCFAKRLTRLQFRHPVWIDDDKQVHYTVPEELAELTEGEKLLIQQVSPYIPLQHLHNGSYGAKGHVCSFPQNIHSICTVLPRLPSNVTSILVVKPTSQKKVSRKRLVSESEESK